MCHYDVFEELQAKQAQSGFYSFFKSYQMTNDTESKQYVCYFLTKHHYTSMFSFS